MKTYFIYKINTRGERRFYRSFAAKTKRDAFEMLDKIDSDCVLCESRPANVIMKKLKSRVSIEAFRKAFLKHDTGNFFVRICDVRRELDWSRDDFDNMLCKLRDECVIQLHVGDVSMLTNDEVDDCFIDENGFRMGTVTWHGKY